MTCVHMEVNKWIGQLRYICVERIQLSAQQQQNIDKRKLN